MTVKTTVDGKGRSAWPNEVGSARYLEKGKVTFPVTEKPNCMFCIVITEILLGVAMYAILVFILAVIGFVVSYVYNKFFDG